jgi:mycofactocin system glycosyltransferase
MRFDCANAGAKMKVSYQRPQPGRYRIARGVHIDGETLVCDYPLRVLRPGPTTLKLVASCGEERTCADLAALLNLPVKRVEKRCEQLYWKGLLDAGPAISPETWPGVSIIIPTYNRARQLERCLAALLNLDYPPDCMEIIVVDDASNDKTGTVLVHFGRECDAREIALHVVRHSRQKGVAMARNSGAEQARMEALAFIDSDCVATPGWLKELTPVFEDAAIGAVGGMIRAYERQSVLGKYENVCSSLFMGVRPQQIKLEGPLTYLPTANFLARRSAWQKVGGFAPLTFGEDVDFCRRLLLSGSAIRYEPRGIVLHDYRTTLPGFLKTRISYASAEAALLKRHPTERRVLVLPPEQATFAGLVMGGVLGMVSPFRRGGGDAQGERGRRKRPHPPHQPPPPLRQYFTGHHVGAGEVGKGGGGACAALVPIDDMGGGGACAALVPIDDMGRGRPQGSPPNIHPTPALTMITGFFLIVAAVLTLFGAYKRLVVLRQQRVSLNPFVVLRATLRGHLAYVYHLCRHLTRYYTLPMLIMGVIFPPLLLFAFILCSIVIGVDFVRLRPRMTLGWFAFCSLLDDCAYEVGVLLGCIKQRTWKPLVPVVKTSAIKK